MKTISIVIVFLLIGCATCRDIAVNNARDYQDQGKTVRIAAYCVGLDGRIVGMGIWSSHVQAQVQEGNEWYWIDGAGQISQNAEFSRHPMLVDRETYDYIWWTLADYEAMLLRRAELSRIAKNPCDIF